MERRYTTLILKVAMQELHIAVTVEDTRRWTLQNASFSPHIWLSPLTLFFRKEVNWHIDNLTMLMDLPQGFHLLVILRDYPLPALHMRDGVLLAELIEPLLARNAELRFQRAFAVVDACMNDLEMSADRSHCSHIQLQRYLRVTTAGLCPYCTMLLNQNG